MGMSYLCKWKRQEYRKNVSADKIHHVRRRAKFCPPKKRKKTCQMYACTMRTEDLSFSEIICQLYLRRTICLEYDVGC